MTGRNIELKARFPELAQARKIATSLANRGTTIEHQIDTYFACPLGRLKLRRRGGLSAQLIAYQRTDRLEATPSEYQILEISDADHCQSLLASALGILCVVDKQREVFLYDNIRIHLDRVDRLGEFLEFEAMLLPGICEDLARQQVVDLIARFGLDFGDLIEVSYSDLLMADYPAESVAKWLKS